ncbi:energy-coupling factor ABC transporter ATP-binding protein [Limnoglobus roseus]|uniref:ABC transporter ATP-binding protein n=1 Tax=Limnoglobus roseus TaxID=2598579 RepID=A0A5C1AGA1_9BACT|nr:ATP-binding cassette domain-containing protein [Limnoglobus roseus]QEL18241.1 cobalt ABC transporter ATP-binding protein [Limnoglobus roseus]
MSEPILEARNVEYAYPGGIVGLAGVTLAVDAGEKLALLGANGCGKTTLLLSLCGVLKPRSGEVRLSGRLVEYTRAGLRNLRQRVGTLLQDADDQLFAGSIYEDVSFGPLNLGCTEAETRQRVEQALAAMELTDLGDRPPYRLSGGQKKRTALAGVAAMKPAVILLDEPTANLDPHASTDLLALLDQMHGQGTTIVFSTHDVDLAYAWADRIAVLDGGRVSACGSPEEIFGDGQAVRGSGLRTPWVLDVVNALQPSALWPSELRPPRTPAALVKQLAAMRIENVR